MSAAQQLQAAADAMVEAAERGRGVLPILKHQCPYVCRQILEDSQHRGILRLWGKSINVDENVGETIVHPAILDAIGKLASVPMRGPGVHAGLQHTYGYLFASIETPYGAKRERWIADTIERGLGVDRTLFSDRPRSGTLLANVTWFAGQIAFRDRPRILRRLTENSSAVAHELVRYDFAALRVVRIIEAAKVSTGASVQFLTDLVSLPKARRNRDDETVLIYSTQTSAHASQRLITMFPVSAQMVHELQEAVPVNGRVKVRPRYNAYVPNWGNPPIQGERRILGERF